MASVPSSCATAEMRATLTELSRVIGQDASNTYKRLQDMVDAGLIRRQGKYYAL